MLRLWNRLISMRDDRLTKQRRCTRVHMSFGVRVVMCMSTVMCWFVCVCLWYRKFIKLILIVFVLVCRMVFWESKCFLFQYTHYFVLFFSSFGLHACACGAEFRLMFGSGLSIYSVCLNKYFYKPFSLKYTRVQIILLELTSVSSLTVILTYK